ncbi:hypothetical protein EVJ58_g4874 [Rhodofomes roseus]|uniref:F-box domain-containing protein n=1 Tax=Rhodofomes roseus TaxID=34475 RepID=A0A4Y9YFT6_9APHY|nr:hypothetical protein EVJ58_g4874 [Rhodofomes roseus]
MQDEWIDIHFRQPVYTSNTVPTFAQELIDFIADFLFDEPVQLARCCLVCRAWYFSARHHLLERTLQSTRALNDLVRILMSRNNRSYGRALRHLTIREHPTKAFAHTFPLRVTASRLSQLTMVSFSQLDWTLKRPHARFFKHLAYFASVTSLILERCRFRHTDELRTTIHALPSLELLSLDSVVFHTLSPDAVRPAFQFRQTLRTLEFWHVAASGDPMAVADGQHLPQCMLDLLALYLTVVKLSLRRTRLLSTSQLFSFIDAFPALRHLHIEGDPLRRSEEPQVFRKSASSDQVIGTAETEVATALTTVRLSEVSSAFALTLIELLVNRNYALEELYVTLDDAPSPALQLAIRECLRQSGPALTEFLWGYRSDILTFWHPGRGDLDLLPPPLTYNTNLQRLTMYFATSSSLGMLWVLGALLALFSQTNSPNLQDAHVAFITYDSVDPALYTVADPALTGTVATFESILSRPEFSDLPPASITVSLRVYNDLHADGDEPTSPASTAEMLHTSSEAVRAILVPLFSSWLARGVMVLELPDGSRISDHPPHHNGGEGAVPGGPVPTSSSLLVLATFAIGHLLVVAFVSLFVLSVSCVSKRAR